MDSDEAEMREAEVRTAEHWSAIMNRARAEIHAAYSAAHAAVNGISAEALQQARTARDSADADWHSDWFVEPVISGYEIKRLQNIVANEQGLLDLNLIPSSQLSLSKHNLEHAIDLQSTQASKSLAAAAVACATQDYYKARYPGSDLGEVAACAPEPIQCVSPYAHFNAVSLSKGRLGQAAGPYRYR